MTTKTGIIYLQKDKFQFMSPFLASIVEFRFTQEMVQDLDVLSSDLLEEQIKLFVANGKIPPSNVIIVLCDNAYFIKDILLPNQPPPIPPKPGQPNTPVAKVSLDDLKPQIDLFVEHVPYENVVSKTFPLKNGVRVCAVNQDFYGTIQSAFEKAGFIVASVFPGMVLGNGLSARPVMDGAMANLILQKAPSFKQYDLISQVAFSAIKEEVESVDEVQDAKNKNQEPPKTNKTRMIAMVGVLVVLLVILVVVFMQSQQPPPPPPPVQPAFAPSQPITLSQVPSVPLETPTSTTINPAQIQNVSVQIINASSSATVTRNLQSELNKYKFKSVAVQTQSNTGAANTVVYFSANTNQAVRNIVLEEVRKLVSDITVQERQSDANNVTIILGK
ncbi:MAG: LytR C-terminal domain-containing protein [Candidatus Levybacteria bacterium]|nr:LytR C-terminal domain-containing protein [Candidatus Levybacteria bacterium]